MPIYLYLYSIATQMRPELADQGLLAGLKGINYKCIKVLKVYFLHIIISLLIFLIIVNLLFNKDINFMSISLSSINSFLLLINIIFLLFRYIRRIFNISLEYIYLQRILSIIEGTSKGRCIMNINQRLIKRLVL